MMNRTESRGSLRSSGNPGLKYAIRFGVGHPQPPHSTPISLSFGAGASAQIP